jgi:hypothetical protein
MDKEGEGWVAFFDLLGTKESSKGGTGGLATALKEFRVSVVDRKKLLGPQSKLYHFSDCAFVEVGPDNAEILGFFNWLSSVQRALYEKGFFFKCAVTTGELKEQVDPNIDPGSPRAFSSISFESDSAVKAYELHEAFKGIGVFFDSSVVTDAEARNIKVKGSPPRGIEFLFDKGGVLRPFVPSFFPPAPDAQLPSVRTYSDLRLPPVCLEQVRRGPSPKGQGKLDLDDVPEGSDLSEPELFLRVIRNFSKANLKSQKYGSYYLSLLCTVVSSSDFGSVELDKNDHKPKLKGHPLIALHLLRPNAGSRKSMLRTLRSVHGFEFLVFRLIDQYLTAFSQEERGKAARAIAEKLDEYSDTLRVLRFADSRIIAPGNQEFVLDAFGERAI